MAEYSFVIEGEPIPKRRMTRYSKWTEASKRSLQYQETIAWEIKSKIGAAETITAPIGLSIRFYKKSKRGDLSNLIKAVEDGVEHSGIIKNDSQIRELICEIFEDKKNPRVEIKIWQKGN